MSSKGPEDLATKRKILSLFPTLLIWHMQGFFPHQPILQTPTGCPTIWLWQYLELAQTSQGSVPQSCPQPPRASHKSQAVTYISDQPTISWGFPTFMAAIWRTGSKSHSSAFTSPLEPQKTKRQFYMGMQVLSMATPQGSARQQSKMHSSQLPPGMGLIAHFPSCCPRVRNLGALCQELEPETKCVFLIKSELLTRYL